MIAEAPGSQKIVFCPRAVDRGSCFAVDEEHVVTLAPPSILILENGHSYPGKVSPPFGLHPYVIAFAGKIFLLDRLIPVRIPVTRPSFGWRRLSILGVEVEFIRGQRFGISAVVDVEVARVYLHGALVGHGDPGVLVKGHWAVAVEG